MPGVVGRERELAAVESLLDAARDGLSVLVLEGEAGIGKSTVWREAVRTAEDRGFRVLTCRPVEAETKLAFTSIGDLLADVSDEVVQDLPEPQRVALEVALLRASPHHAPSDSRIVGTALLSTLTRLAAASPMLVAIDDVQWLDTASAVVLEFALRRLGDERVALVGSRRPSARGRLRPEALVEPERRFDVTLRPLSLAATHHVLKQHLGHSPPRSTLVRIHRAAGGNPLFALEITRLLDELGAPRVDEPLPVPSDVEAIVRRRIATLPATTRDVLLAAATLGRARVDVLREALAREIDVDLELAERHAIAERERGLVTFRHPLFGAALYTSAAVGHRRAVHRRLAEVVTDPEERARHMALGAEGPDPAVTRALEAAARLAGSRGAPAAAAELLELALRSTPGDDSAHDGTRLALVQYHSLAGDFRSAVAVLEQLVDRLESDLRARALLLRADVEYWTTNAEAACASAEQALAAAESLELRARCHAVIGISSIHDVQRSAKEAAAALALIERVDDPDPETLSLALCTRVRGNLFLGNGLDTAALERAVELEVRSPPANVQDRARFKQGQLLKYVDDLDRSRALLEESHRAAVDEGDEASLVNVLVNLSTTECWAGDWPTARAYAERAAHVAADLGAYPQGPASYAAHVDAHLGNAEAVSRAATGAVPSGEPVVDGSFARSLGLVSLAVGEHALASEHLGRALTLFGGAGFAEPAVFRVHGDAIEAALAAGDVVRAEELLEPFEEQAARVPVPWSVAVSSRCRALVQAARGDLDGATSAMARALAVHDGCPVPFELARTLLAAGRLHRRANRRRAASDTLEQAHAIFAELGGSLWAEQARGELARVPVRRRSGSVLTPSEQRVAELVAQGGTNEEIAQALFVTKKTVEANLTRIYRKLGVRSRAALVARWSRTEPGEGAEAAEL